MLWVVISSALWRNKKTNFLGPVVQSIFSLTSLLVVKILTVLLSTVSNSQVFVLEKWEKLLQMQMQKLLTFFHQKY